MQNCETMSPYVSFLPLVTLQHSQGKQGHPTESENEEQVFSASLTLPARRIDEEFLTLEMKLMEELKKVVFSFPVTHVYNPLEYAFDPHSKFVRRYCTKQKKILFVGMNPGPFGMAQTGVPFGEVSIVRDWLEISGEVDRPKSEHPKRQILGFKCKRSEVSGRRFWSLFRELSLHPENFFRYCFVHNLCPLLFMSQSGKNITPDKLHVHTRDALNRACDRSLCDTVRLLGVTTVVGVGRYAYRKAKMVLKCEGMKDVTVVEIMHPSPANPKANRDWRGIVLKQLNDFDLLKFFHG